MRRKEREVSDPKQLDQIIENCDCCRIAFMDEDIPYIVPLSFGYERYKDTCCFYFHCAKVGRKLDLMKRSNKVGFELDTAHELLTANKACAHTYRYQSVIGSGTIEIIEDKQAKIAGLLKIMKHYTNKDDWQFANKGLDAMHLLCLTVHEISAKQYKEMK